MSDEVAEFQRYNGRKWRIYQLKNSEYPELPSSPTFSIISKENLYEFLVTVQSNEVVAEVNLRQ